MATKCCIMKAANILGILVDFYWLLIKVSICITVSEVLLLVYYYFSGVGKKTISEDYTE